MSAATLEIEDLSVSFGAVQSLRAVSLNVRAGETVGLIGPNGAGKTTLLNAVSGFVRASGRIALEETPLLGLSPDRRARLGIGRTFQQPQLFEAQTVRENLRVAADQAGRTGDRIEEVAQLIGLTRILNRPAHELPSHARTLLEISRALVLQPKVLLLDEPAAGLLPHEVEKLAALIVRLQDRAVATAILVIDHNMDFVFEIADRVYVLDFGELLFHGTASEVQASQTVIDAYLGKE